MLAKFPEIDFRIIFYLTFLNGFSIFLHSHSIFEHSVSVQMSSVNLSENVEKTLAIKEFKRDYSLMAKFFFILDPDGYKNKVLQRFGRYQ